MSKQPKSSASTTPAPRPASGARGTTASRPVSAATQEQIAVRAYEIFIARGQQDGRDLEDWLQAESELRLGKQ
ncbi:MAG TPA: DUF2934 domain-containing protein [Myxococcaceae bacterium]|nr:DUF2934 domain-containing protein [Myxococcaceae bacterium]